MSANTAIETADVALMDDDLRKIPAFIRLSRQTSSILRQNITLALFAVADTVKDSSREAIQQLPSWASKP